MKRVIIFAVAMLMFGSVLQAGVDVVGPMTDAAYGTKEFYTVTAPGLWEIKVLKDTGAIVSFKDLTDSGAAAFGNRHQNYLGDDPTTGVDPCWGFQYALFRANCRSRVLFGGGYSTDVAHRYTFSAAGTNLDYFEITYTERGDGVSPEPNPAPAYAFEGYDAAVHGTILTTAKLRINAPTAAGTFITLTMDSTNQTADVMPSNIFAENGSELWIRTVGLNGQYYGPQELNYTDNTTANTSPYDGAWNPSSPNSYRKVNIVAGTKTATWGYKVGRTFILDHVEGAEDDPLTWGNGPVFNTSGWAGAATWQATFGHGGWLCDLNPGATKHYESQLIINLGAAAEDKRPSQAQCSNSADPTTDIEADGLQASTITIMVKNAASEPIGGLTNADFEITSSGTGNVFSTVTEMATAGTYTLTMKSTVAEVKDVQVGIIYTPEPPALPETIYITPTMSITFIPAFDRRPSLAQCSREASPDTVQADGFQASTITIALKNAASQAISGLTAASFVVTSSGTGNVFSTVTETATPGTYTLTMRSTVAEAKSVLVGIIYTPAPPGLPETVYLTPAMGITFTPAAEGGLLAVLVEQNVDSNPDTNDNYYVVTAPGNWEARIDQRSGCIYSFKDLADWGVAGNHTNYLDGNYPGGYNFVRSLIMYRADSYQSGGNGYILSRMAAENYEHRLTFSLAADHSSFTIHYAEAAGDTVKYIYNADNGYITRGDVLTTFDVVLNAPSPTGTTFNWKRTAHCVNEAARTIYIGNSTNMCLAVSTPSGLQIDTTRTGTMTSWSAVVDNSAANTAAGLNVGRTFVLTQTSTPLPVYLYPDTPVFDGWAGFAAMGLDPGFDWGTVPAGTDIVQEGTVTIDLPQLGTDNRPSPFRCTNTANPTVDIPANGFDASTIAIAAKNAAGQPISGLASADFVITSDGTGNLFSAVTETGLGIYTLTMKSTVAETKEVLVGIIYTPELPELPETIYVNPTLLITFIPPVAADPFYSRVVNTGLHVIKANGIQVATFTVTLRNVLLAHGLISGGAATGYLTATVGGTGNTVTAPLTEVSPGVYTMSVSSTVAEIKQVTVTYNDGVNPAIVLDDLYLYFEVPVAQTKLVYSGDDISATTPLAQRAYLRINAANVASVAGLVTIEGNGGSVTLDFGAAGSMTMAQIEDLINGGGAYTTAALTLVEAWDDGTDLYLDSFASGELTGMDRIGALSSSSYIKITLGAGGVFPTMDIDGTVPTSQDFGVSPAVLVIQCVRIDNPADVRWELHVKRIGNDILFAHFYDMTDAGLTGGGHFEYVGHANDRYNRSQGLLLAHAKDTDEFSQTQPIAAAELAKSESQYQIKVVNGGSPGSYETVYTVRPSSNLGGSLVAARTVTNVDGNPWDISQNVGGAVGAMGFTTNLGVGPYNGRAYDLTTNPNGGCVLTDPYDVNLYRYHLDAGLDQAIWKVTDTIDLDNHALVDAGGTGLVNFPWPAGSVIDPYQVMWAKAEVMASDAQLDQGLVAGRTFTVGTDIAGYYPVGSIGNIYFDNRAGYLDGLVIEETSREWWATAGHFEGSDWVWRINPYYLDPGASITKSFIVLWDIGMGIPTGLPDLVITASANFPWVYQNTAVTTVDRHKSVLTVNITAGGTGGETYAITVGENGGAVANFQVTQPVAIVAGTPQAVDVFGGRRATTTAAGYTLNVTVTGTPGAQTATVNVPLALRLLADIDGDGSVTAADKLEMNKNLNGLATLPGIGLRELDLTGDGATVNAEDKLVINQVLNGLIVP